MEWKKVKSLLLALLFIANLLLGYNIFSQIRAKSTAEKNMLKQAVDYVNAAFGAELQENLVTALPKTMHGYTIARSEEAEEQLARTLLGESGFVLEQSGGGIVRYFSDSGYGEIVNGFEIDFTMYHDGAVEGAEYFANLLQTGGIETRDYSQTAMGGYMFFQSINGLPLYDFYLTCTAQEGRIHIIGKWAISPNRTQSGQTGTRAEHLLQLPFNLLENAAITDIEVLLLPSFTRVGEISAHPGWKIKTANGDYCFNLKTGEFFPN